MVYYFIICFTPGWHLSLTAIPLEGSLLDNHLYAAILDAVPKTGVYVVREADHALLYLNKRAKELSPGAQLGNACPGQATGSCGICLLSSMGGKAESQAVSFDSCIGEMVDLTASRILWDDAVPAFVVTSTPHSDTASFTYRKILHADLQMDRCNILKFDPNQWRPSPGSLSQIFASLCENGAIHPQDVGRFTDFTSLDHLRSAAQSGQDALSLIYRRMSDGSYRWNLMEVFPWQDNVRYAIICVKDVHDMLQEGLERMGPSLRSQELIRSLGEQNFDIYTIDLHAGSATPVRVDNVMRDELVCTDWNALMHSRILQRLHEAYQDEFECRFSLEGLRQAREMGQQKTELLCQWRSEDTYRYISATAYFGETANYTVLALQDVDERMRRELAHTNRDMQMAAILKSRFQMMNTVDLETGMCERINLSQPGSQTSPLSGDYTSYIENALAHFVHPEDVPGFRAVLSLEHLRQKADSIRDSGEEVFQYRLRGDEERWIELHVLYSRQKGQDHVMVNILGQDVTTAKQQETSHLRALEDRAYMITSLSSLFFSTYYVDLERDTFRAVTQQKPVSRMLGAEVNFTTALQLYANQFIHPDDREQYLHIMSVENLLNKLRWWQPYVSFEYRKLPDLPTPDGSGCQWVRATAVLSRMGSDDMPKTAVYVARSISEDDRTEPNGV